MIKSDLPVGIEQWRQNSFEVYYLFMGERFGASSQFVK
jgi:hypothetical protein